LASLDLAGNTNLGDEFAATFLGKLYAPRLQCLNLSVVGLTEASHDHILSFLGSSRSRSIRILLCNGNRLTNEFANGLLETIRTRNFSLYHIELHGNLLNTVTNEKDVADLTPSSSLGSSHYSLVEERRDSPKKWPECEALLKNLLERNRLYCKWTMSQAFSLLPYARALFLRPMASQDGKTGISSLPVELKVTILNFLVPMLSPGQCHRICQYVSSLLNENVGVADNLPGCRRFDDCTLVAVPKKGGRG